MEFAYLEDTEQDLLKKLAEVCDRRCATAFLHKSVDREERRRKQDEEVSLWARPSRGTSIRRFPTVSHSSISTGPLSIFIHTSPSLFIIS
jgi:hypothetical protein